MSIDNSINHKPPSLMAGLVSTPSSAANSIANLPKPNEEVWVENKSSDGRVYYYNARTRESSWTKPVSNGTNSLRIITQEEVERMAAVNTKLQQVTVNSIKETTTNTESTKSESSVALVVESTSIKNGEQTTQPATIQPPLLFQPPPFGMPPPGMFPPPSAGVGSPFGGMPPPPFGIPPFGMPPPFMGMPPPFGALAPPPFMQQQQSLHLSLLDDPKYTYPDELKREIRECEEKLAKCREESILYTEHDTPDGKKYYFNTKLNQSFWDKPKCIVEQAELESKLEQFKKKRIERTTQELNNNKNLKDKEKENELSEEEKAKQKSKPISSTAVPGTPWCVVWTRDKRVFYFNPSEKISLWERPSILVGRLDVDQMVKEPPANVLTESSKKKQAEPSSSEPPSKKNKLVEEQDDGSTSPRSRSMSPATSTTESPSRQVAPDEFLQKNKIEASKEAALEAEHKAAQVRAQLPFDQRVQQFKELLIEKSVSAYSTWEKELQKIVFDPRYLLLTSKERKQVFDKYVRDRANQESKERVEKLKRKRDEFKELLKEAKLDAKDPISFSEFSVRYAKDERFKSIEKVKDRESLFYDYLSELKKHDKEDKYSDKEKLKKSFIQMLKEIKHLHKYSSWTETKKQIENDSRYRAIESSSKREDYFRDYCKYLDEKNDGENGAGAKDETSATTGTGSGDEDEKRKEKEKKERIEASLRERNKEVKEQLSKYQNEREKEREQLKRDEAIESFKALLIDLLKPGTSSDLSWKEAKKMLKRDSRWSYCKILEKDEKEKLFQDHMGKFKAKKRDLFYQLLDETEGIQLKGSTWKEVKKMIKTDPRYEKLSSSESFKMEKEFDNYINEKYEKAVEDFKELLLQTKMISYKSLTSLKENSNHLKEIEDYLSKDKSWIVLDCVPEKRKKILMEYIEKLDKEGPPPPPTATEPSTRRPK